jgi:hypothetical protein
MKGESLKAQAADLLDSPRRRHTLYPMRHHRGLAAFPFVFLVIAAGCGGNKSQGFSLTGLMVDGGVIGPDGAIVQPDGTMGTLPGTPLPGTDASSTGDASLVQGDPTTCAQAAASKSYVGCEYWPTVTANVVWSGFDFTAVVANTQTVAASVTVTGPAGFSTTAMVPPSGLTKIYLPWVDALKGSATTGFTSSVTVAGGAYHLISSVPVTVYQFNALEYVGAGGPAGKSWTQCDPNDPNPPATCCPNENGSMGCFSYTNDASVLIPVAAMTGNYRVTGEHGSTAETDGAIIAITGTTNGTMVTVTTSGTASIVASMAGDIATTGANKTLTFMLNAGDVAELLGIGNDQVDLSGSLVYATNPVQVISARQCANQPDPIAACDHLESIVLPAETLGKDYVVTVPTSPHQTVVGHKVRFFGNVDGTVLTYSPSQPPGCPSTLNAGEVGECTGTPNCAKGTDNIQTDPNFGGSVSVSCVTTSFEVTGTHEFAVSSFMLGGSAVDPNDSQAEQEGDPSMSPMVATEQYRSRYVFLAPTDYTESYADVVLPTGATILLDGVPITATPTPLNATWAIARVALAAGEGGAHLITSSVPFGVQVIGYGAYTSYQYPAGLDLAQIAPPPPPPPGIK